MTIWPHLAIWSCPCFVVSFNCGYFIGCECIFCAKLRSIKRFQLKRSLSRNSVASSDVLLSCCRMVILNILKGGSGGRPPLPSLVLSGFAFSSKGRKIDQLIALLSHSSLSPDMLSFFYMKLVFLLPMGFRGYLNRINSHQCLPSYSHCTIKTLVVRRFEDASKTTLLIVLMMLIWD